MRLWTIQEEPVWLRAQDLGYFNADITHPGAFGREFQFAYDWMFHQMRFRMPGFSGRYPVWAWTERPNLRETYQSSLGWPWLLLELEVPDDQVLLSDFSDWHQVLNMGYLPTPEEEALPDFFDEGKGFDQKGIVEVVLSWNRVFDLKPDEKLQACVDRLTPSHVVSVTKFKGRRERSKHSVIGATYGMSKDQDWRTKHERISEALMNNEATDGLMPSAIPYSNSLEEAMRVLKALRECVYVSRVGLFYITDHPDGYLVDVEGYRGVADTVERAIVNCAINYLDWIQVRKEQGFIK